jgi:8-amino-7-oxononanoate synthase
MATLGKAVGVSGAFVAGSGELIDYLRHKARGYVYSTASSPLTAALTLASLTYIENNKSYLHQQLYCNVAMLKQAALAQGWQTTHSLSHHHAIISLTLGTAEAAMQVAQVLQSHNLLVSAIRPPTVPSGSSRLRITVSAAHQQCHMDALIDALAAVKNTLGD